MARFTSGSQIGTDTVPWDTWLFVPKVSGVLTAEVSFKPTIIMQFIRSVFRGDPVYISLLFANGERVTYRLVPDNMTSGLWINPFPATVNDFRSLMAFGHAQQVIAVRFESRLVSRLSSDIAISWVRYGVY